MGNESSKNGGTGSGRGEPKPTGSKISLPSINLKVGGPSDAALRRHVDNAKKSRTLQLQGLGIKRLPEAVGEVLALLRTIDLSNNKLRDLPPVVGTMVELRLFTLTNNQLQSVPDEIGFLKKLETLHAANNAITTLPASLSDCSALKTVTLSQNALTTFPVVLCHLPSLDILDLSHNKIAVLPDEIGEIHASELNLNSNQLASLNSRLVDCSRLRTLRVEENCLPKEAFTKEFLEKSHVAIITYAGNLFADKEFQDRPGYPSYQDRYTATRRKM